MTSLRSLYSLVARLLGFGVVLLSSASAIAIETPALWLGGVATYNDATNWDVPAVPCDAGPVDFLVTVPAGSGNKPILDITCSVNALDIGTDAGIQLNPGAEMTVDLNLQHDGIMMGMGGDLTSVTGTSFLGSRARIQASGGSTIAINALAYAPLDLRLDNGFSSVATYTWDILLAADAGTMLDLSSVGSFDAGFPQTGNDRNRHEVSALNGAAIDLSGVATLASPAGSSDWIRFTVDGASSSIDLSSLATANTALRGTTRFELLNGATLDLPSLTSMTAVRMDLSGASTLTMNGAGASYSSAALALSNGFSSVATYTWPLVTVSDPGTSADLSAITMFDAGFPQTGNDRNRHEVTASSGATIDLSGVTTLMTPGGLNDWIRFRADGAASSIDLSSLGSLAPPSGRGSAVFDLAGGALQQLPVLQSATAAQVWAVDMSVVDFRDPLDPLATTGGLSQLVDPRISLASGAQLIDDLTPSTLSTLGLRRDNFFSSVEGYTWNILLAADAGTMLDLSSVGSFDAGFPQTGNDRNRHEVSALNGAAIDLSGVATLASPAGSSDWIRFTVDGASSSIDLSSLATANTALRGTTRFELLNGATLDLPALTSMTAVRMDLSGASTLNLNGASASYSSTPLALSNGFSSVATYTWPLVTASDPGTTADLSAITMFDAGFPQTGNDRNRHEVMASGGATIDLSGVTKLLAPTGVNDWIRFKADGGTIDLSGLVDVTSTGSGQVRFETLGSGHIHLHSLTSIGAITNFALSNDSTVDTSHLFLTREVDATLNDTAELAVMGAELDANSDVDLQAPGTVLDVGDWGLDLDEGAELTAAAASTVEIAGDYRFANMVEAEIALADSFVVFDGDASGGIPQIVEVGGFDIGPLPPADDNFGFGQMVVGTLTQPGFVRLVDRIDNGNHPGSCDDFEALYLFGAGGGDGLVLHPGSVLQIDHISTYAWDATAGQWVWLNGMFGSGVTAVAFGNGTLFRNLADTDADSIIDSIDNCIIIPNNGQEDNNCNRVGNVCECGDTSGDGFVDTIDANLDQRCAVGQPLGAVCDPLLSLCDANFDGVCNTLDARLVQRRAIGDLTADDFVCAVRPFPF